MATAAAKARAKTLSLGLGMEELSIGFMRYEALRKLNPEAFARLYAMNLEGRNFDELVDSLATGCLSLQPKGATR